MEVNQLLEIVKMQKEAYTSIENIITQHLEDKDRQPLTDFLFKLEDENDRLREENERLMNRQTDDILLVERLRAEIFQLKDNKIGKFVDYFLNTIVVIGIVAVSVIALSKFF